MTIEAFCDGCGTPVPRDHAETHKPCPKCGNTFYLVLDRERQMPSGNYAYRSQRQRNMDEYYDTLQAIQEIRITGMTAETYARYVGLGERNIASLEKAMDEYLEMDRRANMKPELPPNIPMPTKLPDMYMRHDRWEDALRVYDFCAAIPHLGYIDFDRLKKECIENRSCADAIESLVASGVTSQRAVRKALFSRFSSRPINYCLAYSQRFNRVKFGSDYTISLTSSEERF